MYLRGISQGVGINLQIIIFVQPGRHALGSLDRVLASLHGGVNPPGQPEVGLRERGRRGEVPRLDVLQHLPTDLVQDELRVDADDQLPSRGREEGVLGFPPQRPLDGQRARGLHRHFLDCLTQ